MPQQLRKLCERSLEGNISKRIQIAHKVLFYHLLRCGDAEGLGAPCCKLFSWWREAPRLLDVPLAGTTKAADVEEDIGRNLAVALVVPETEWAA